MSHELRSPLNAILGFAQLMESDTAAPTPSQKASIDEILRAGWYLLELINEILDLAQIESGKLSLSPEPTSLGEVLLECQAMIEPQAQQRGITMTFPQFPVPCFVKADRTRLKQVLINLLSNAIKYNKTGGTVVVDCDGCHAPGRIRLNVRDTGPGLSAEKLTQLFQPFNRLGQERGAEQGTGIGLVMSKRLVELMGGALGVESRVGEGSTFWWELAAAAAPKLHLKTALPEAARAEAQAGGPLRTLLYVEDNPANLKLIEQLIARRPTLRLLTAVDGNVGIQMARAHQPDVVLMDINLPGISGIEALKILRDDPETAHIPIVALSANAMPRDVEKGITAGFFSYLTKPIKVDEFMTALDAALESGPANA
jgi:CheY-like chemotaxis protein